MSTEYDRPLILVGPDGKTLRLQDGYQNPEKWDTLETEDAVVMVARPSTLARKASLMDQISAFVQEHLREPLPLKRVAEHCGVSISTITQLFHKQHGFTFHQYVTKQRMAAASQLVRSGMPLEEVGKQVGYTDHSTFYRAFRQHFGQSPREYRKQLDKEGKT